MSADCGDPPDTEVETEEPTDSASTVETNRRDVVVPTDLYKIITVFSTLIAILSVVGGFILLDTATNRTLAAPSEVDLPLAILGVGAIVLGAAVYAFATRFRTAGMGSDKDNPDE
jgi:uncharacterized integral membrane protein